MIDWVRREERTPEDRRKVLAWGHLPALWPSTGSSFLGETRFNGKTFDLDGSGHCGLVEVTHWAEITPPEEET